jgi:hypothetical protein
MVVERVAGLPTVAQAHDTLEVLEWCPRVTVMVSESNDYGVGE